MKHCGLDRGGRDLGANVFDIPHLQMPLFHHAARWHVHTAPTFQVSDLFGEFATIAGEGDGIERGQGIHERDEIRRTERLEDKASELFARANRGHELTDVVLVPENQEHSDVVACGLRRRVIARSNGKRQIVGRLTCRFEQLERGDWLLNAVLEDLEIICLQRPDQFTV